MLSACEQNTFVQPPPPKVDVATPVQRSFTRYLEATGNTAPIKNVDLVARVQGFLQSINYKDGAFVKEGTPLFTIEPDTYKLKLEQAQAAESGAQATLRQAEADFKRQQDLVQRQAVSQATLDTSTSTRDNAQANLLQAQVNTKIAAVNYGYTNVAAPFDGVVSAHLVSIGELVGASSPTQLATIVALDPIWVNFNVNEQDVLRIRTEARRRGMTVDDLRQLPIEVGLQTETGFPHKGRLDYAAVTLNQSTGTLPVRGVLPNSDRALLPGFFVRAGRGARQRPGRTLFAGRERRECRRAAQGPDRAPPGWRAARDRGGAQGRRSRHHRRTVARDSRPEGRSATQEDRSATGCGQVGAAP
jgi:RND family efflux transporter MFP subunit